MTISEVFSSFFNYTHSKSDSSFCNHHQVLKLTPHPGHTDRIKLIVDILGEGIDVAFFNETTLQADLHPSFCCFTPLTDGKPKEVQKGSDQATILEKKRRQEVEQADREDKIKQSRNEDRKFKDNQIQNFNDDRSRRESHEQELARLKRQEKKREAELAGRVQDYENRRMSDSTDRLKPHDAATKVSIFVQYIVFPSFTQTLATRLTVVRPFIRRVLFNQYPLTPIDGRCTVL